MALYYYKLSQTLNTYYLRFTINYYLSLKSNLTKFPYKNQSITNLKRVKFIISSLSPDSFFQLATGKLIFQQLIGSDDSHRNDIEHALRPPDLVVEFLNVNGPHDSPESHHDSQEYCRADDQHQLVQGVGIGDLFLSACYYF
jgi:hypothetical protein